MDEVITDRGRLEVVHAAAIRWLVERGHAELAVALARAALVRLEVEGREIAAHVPFHYREAQYWLEASPALRLVLTDEADWVFGDSPEVGHRPGLVIQAFAAVEEFSPTSFPAVHLVAPTTEVGRHQGDLYPGPGQFVHEGVRYRSHTETRIAQALDEANVLYFPLPTAIRHHQKVEPDFVVVHLGRIGVLEIDGPHHTPMTRAREDARAAWLLQSGVRHVHHVAVGDVDRDAAGVVRNFLTLLRGPTL